MRTGFVRRAAVLLIVAAVGIWVVAVFRYDPWRRNRVCSVMPRGTSWQDAVVAGEAAAFPGGEEFVAYCMAGDGPAAEFWRASRGSYRLVQNGRLQPSEGRPQRVRTSEETYADRAAWASAVSNLGNRLRCDSLTIIWPPTDVIDVDLDNRGRLLRVSTSAGD